LSKKTNLIVALGVIGRPYKLQGEVFFFPYNIDSTITYESANVLIGKNEKSLDSMHIDSYNSRTNILKINKINSKELASKLSKKKNIYI